MKEQGTFKMIIDFGHSSRHRKLSADDLRPADGFKILLLGEGDFSFALSLAEQIGGKGIVATSYDSKREVKQKYSRAASNLEQLSKEGAEIEYEVNAKDLRGTLTTAGKYQYIIFNFPYIPERRRGETKANRALLDGFFKSAFTALAENGMVFLTLASQYYIRRWKPLKRAQAYFVLSNRFSFDSSNFPGYQHRMTVKNGSAEEE